MAAVALAALSFSLTACGASPEPVQGGPELSWALSPHRTGEQPPRVHEPRHPEHATELPASPTLDFAPSPESQTRGASPAVASPTAPPTSAPTPPVEPGRVDRPRFPTSNEPSPLPRWPNGRTP